MVLMRCRMDEMTGRIGGLEKVITPKREMSRHSRREKQRTVERDGVIVVRMGKKWK